MKKTNFVRLAVFYLTAITLSNLFRFDLFHWQAHIEKLPTWILIFYGPLQAIGVFLGALIALHWLARERTPEISVFGTSKKFSLLMSSLPIILLVSIGVHKEGVNSHYFGFISGVMTLIYCFFEEIGWRGYLEQEFKNFSELIRVVFIAVLWYFWHLPFFKNPDLIQNLMFFGWLLLGSWGLGKIVHVTKSILAVACFHLVINILLFNSYIKAGLESTDKIIIFSVLVSAWVLILIFWEKGKLLVKH